MGRLAAEIYYTRRHGGPVQALTLPRILAFSVLVWKRPWPILEAVSMNLILISSRAERDIWGKSDLLRVMHLFFVPGTAPCNDAAAFQHEHGKRLSPPPLPRQVGGQGTFAARAAR